MEETVVKEGEQKKLSYEELEKVAQDAIAQNRQLYATVQQANNVIAKFNRLDYLLAVVKISDKFPKAFINKCIDEIVEVMTIPENQPEEEK